MTEVLPDVLTHGLTLVFCGTAASDVSARDGAYYANSSNAFWRSLHEVGLTPRLFEPREYRLLPLLGIGMTDLAKSAIGADRQLRTEDFKPDELTEKMRRFQPSLLAFTSKTAWRVWRRLPSRMSVAYGRQELSLVSTRIFVLTSPSAAARRYWDLSPWRQLAAAYRDARSA